MNEQLKSFYDQIGVDFENFQRVTITKRDMEKFAELIIKEYEQLLPDYCPWIKAEENGPMKGWHVAFVARKHFGVE